MGPTKGLEGLKTGRDIIDDRILPKLLKIAILPPKIAHPYLLEVRKPTPTHLNTFQNMFFF